MVATLSIGTSLLLLLALSASGESADTNDKLLQFPPDFLLGTATAAYQIEGGWNAGGKGESVWDRFAHLKGNRIYQNDTGDVAADSYHKYKEDVALMKKIGFKAYRFSVSWPRLLPTGLTNMINKDGVRYYHNLIDELLRNNIEPMMTLYHWDQPQYIEEMGGWTNPEIVDWFGEYARFVFREYGSKVKRFIPVNEPSVFCKNGYSYAVQAPAKDLHGVGEYKCIHNAIKAHARAYRIYESEFKAKQKGQVGFLINSNAYIPKDPSQQEAANISFEFNSGWTLHPVFIGGYPPIMLSRVAKKSMEQGYPRSRLPDFDQAWIKYIKGTADFLALNHYTSRLVTAGTVGLVPSHDNDQGVEESIDSKWGRAASAWLAVYPEGFRILLRQLADYCGNPPVYITENGYSDFGTLDDVERINYFREYLKQMLLAIYEDGVNVKGYLLWSIIDNFEWNSGYHEHFGLVSVNFTDPNRTRTMKKSATWWQKVIAENTVQN